jgi:UDP-glucuronate decarboxylase
MDNRENNPGPVNIGNSTESSILDIAALILRLADSRSQLVLQPLPADDPRQRQPDITEARRLLDWEPTTDLEDGLCETIAYFRRIL